MTTGFTSVFGGSTVYPAPITYAAYTITAGATLVTSWAVDNFPAGANPLARINAITPGAGCTLQLPPATNAGLGETGLFINNGTGVLTVSDNGGNTVASVGLGIAYYIYLIDNTTTNGVWATFQFGAGTSTANAAALAGSGLKAIGSTLNQSIPVTSLNTNYVSTTTDRGTLFNWTGGAGTFTLPAAVSSGNNFFVQVRNSGSGSLVITPTGGDTVNGASSLTFNIGDSAIIVTDGASGWYTLGYGTVNTNTFNFLSVALGGISGTYVLPAGQQNKVAYKFSGALAGNTNISVPATIQQYWVDNECTGGTLGIGTATQIAGATQIALTAGARYILYCDGVNVLNADTSGIAVPISILQGGTGATTAGGALINLGGTSLGISLFTAASVAAAQSALGITSSSDNIAFAMGF